MATTNLLSFVGSVGPNAVSDGATPLVRLGRSGEEIIQELHGRYYESTFRRAMFNASIAGQVTTVGTATTYTGLALSNPPSSPVNLVLNKCGYSFTVAFPAAAVIGLMAGYSGTAVTHTSAVKVYGSVFTGQASGNWGLVDSSAALPATPVLNTILATGFTGAITTTPCVPQTLVDLEGSIILPPGGFVAFYTSTVSGTAAGNFSFSWEEVAI